MEGGMRAGISIEEMPDGKKDADTLNRVNSTAVV